MRVLAPMTFSARRIWSIDRCGCWRLSTRPLTTVRGAGKLVTQPWCDGSEVRKPRILSAMAG